MQKGMRLNDGHITYLGLLAKKDGTRRGCLSKKSSDNTKWHSKWFALLQNMLFYFENESSSRPSGLYLLEGCVCDRSLSPKPSLSAKECLEKQVGLKRGHVALSVCPLLCNNSSSSIVGQAKSASLISKRPLLEAIFIWTNANEMISMSRVCVVKSKCHVWLCDGVGGGLYCTALCNGSIT